MAQTKVKPVSKGGPGAIIGAISLAVTSWLLESGQPSEVAYGAGTAAAAIAGTAWNFIKHEFFSD